MYLFEPQNIREWQCRKLEIHMGWADLAFFRGGGGFLFADEIGMQHSLLRILIL